MLLKKILKRENKSKRRLLVTVSLMLALGGAGIQVAGEVQKKEEVIKEEDTLYGIGSVSKVFTAVAAMQLVEQGKLKLDEPITTYLPEFHMADERYQQITMRMLLNHSSGLMGSTFSNNILFEDNDTIAHDDLLARLSTQRLKAKPGLYSTYCNDGFVLAEVVIERVSGKSFTEYLEHYIFNPLDMKKSGTPINRLNEVMQVDTYFDDSTLFSPEYCSVIGTGGILSTAEELCKFGAIFTEKYGGLLSKTSLQEMQIPASKQTEYGYVEGGSLDQYGLGWDSVDMYPFNEQGIKALVKGGDVLKQHGMLMVLPEENISISVLSSGGSSTFNGLLAQELATIALEEQGIELTSEEKIVNATEKVESTPKEYLGYAGVYANTFGMYKVSFPNETYLQLESCDTEIPRVQIYHYTKEDLFVPDDYQYISSEGIVSPSGIESGYTTLKLLSEVDNQRYLSIDTTLNHTEVGKSKLVDLFAQKVQENTLSDSVSKAWDKRDGKKYYLTSEKYSSAFWIMNPVVKLKLSNEQEGYINASGIMGPTKIVDEYKAKAFVTLSGGMGRDLNDLSFVQKEMGEHLYLENVSMYYLEETQIPDLVLSTQAIELKGEGAKWYNIGEQAKGKTVYLKPSEEMAVYVYDEYDECIYSSYMKNRESRVILPKGGKLVVVGEVGSQLEIQAV